jgi:hypothetical protein
MGSRILLGAAGPTALAARSDPSWTQAVQMRSAKCSNPRLIVFVTVLSIFLFVAFLVEAAITAANYWETRTTAEHVADDTSNRHSERRVIDSKSHPASFPR